MLEPGWSTDAAAAGLIPSEFTYHLTTRTSAVMTKKSVYMPPFNNVTSDKTKHALHDSVKIVELQGYDVKLELPVVFRTSFLNAALFHCFPSTESMSHVHGLMCENLGVFIGFLVIERRPFSAISDFGVDAIN